MTGQAALVVAIVFALWAAWHTSRVKRLKIIVVIDGDTYEAVNTRGKKYRLRIRGCDCPESDQPLGAWVTGSVHELIHGQWLSVRFYGRDVYRRHLVTIKLDGRDLTQMLLRRGLAFPMPGKLSPSSVYARFNRLGVWRPSSRVMPWAAPSRQKGLVSWLANAARRRARKHRRKV